MPRKRQPYVLRLDVHVTLDEGQLALLCTTIGVAVQSLREVVPK